MSSAEIRVALHDFTQKLVSDGADVDEVLTALIFGAVTSAKHAKRIPLGAFVKVIIEAWELVF